MKRIRYMLLTIVLAYVLTGCVRLEYDIDIKKNGTFDATVIYAVMESYSDDDEMSSEEISQMEEQGWEYETYSEDGYVGYLFTKKKVPLNEDMFSSLGGEIMEVSNDGGIYAFQTRFFEQGDWEDILPYKSAIEKNDGYIRFVVHLPQKSITNNATSVSDDGKTLTWNLLAMDNQEAQAEFKLRSFPMGIVALVIGLMAAIAIAVLVISKKKKGTQEPEKTIYINRGAPETFFCPYCGTSNSAGAAFCQQCGAKLNER